MVQKKSAVVAQSWLNVFDGTKKQSQYMSFGLIGAMILLGLCVIIRPDSLSVNYGLSYFGIFVSTIAPYTAAFLIYAFCLLKTSDMKLKNVRINTVITWIMRIMAVQIVGLVLTPYDRLYNIHVFFGAGLFSLQLILSFLLIKWLQTDWLNIGLMAVEFLSGLASLYYLPQTRGLLLQTQVVFQLGFGILLVRVLKSLEVPPVNLGRHKIHQS